MMSKKDAVIKFDFETMKSTTFISKNMLKQLYEGYQKSKSLETKLQNMEANYAGAMFDCDHYEDQIKELKAKLQIAIQGLRVIANPKMSMYYSQLVDRAKETIEKIDEVGKSV